MKTRLRPSASPSAQRSWALAGALLGAIVTLAVCAPARWLAAGVAHWSQGQVQLMNPRGTLWQGNASAVLTSGAGGTDRISLPGLLSWRLRPQWSGLQGSMDLPCCAAEPLRFRATPESNGLRLQVDDGASRWPATMLAGLGAPWNTLRLEGALTLTTHALVLQWRQQKLLVQGKVTLDANDISTSLSTLHPIGSYRMLVDGGAPASVLLTTLSGSLQLNGSGQWSGTALRFRGEAAATPDSQDVLSNLLNIIGRREGMRSIITLG